MLNLILALYLWITSHVLTIAALSIAFVIGAAWEHIMQDTKKAAKRANV
ncbi:hypothetical protein [Lacticaseibacillus parakribbianus]|nr:hypothetical protein [Lacticaseibacillus parakribbianus]